MKKSKLLFLVPSVAVATSIPFISSCSKHGLLIEDIEDAIFHPVKDPQIVEEGTSYVDKLKSASKKELQKELIYRLFAPGDEWFTEQIEDAYNDGAINIVSNIKTCEITFGDTSVLASFVGYIDFIFKDDWQSFKKNDIWQITFMLNKWDVTPKPTGVWYLNFEKPDQSRFPFPIVFGIMEVVKDGEMLPLIPIDSLQPAEIPNWHHWTNN